MATEQVKITAYCVVRLSWDNELKQWTGNRGNYNAGNTVSIDRAIGHDGYVRTLAPIVGYIPITSIPAVVVIPPPPPAPSALNLWRTKFAQEIKDLRYRPEDVNYGSFAIMWLMEQPKIEKPVGWNLTAYACTAIRSINSWDGMKWNWLLDQEGTRKILSQDAEALKPVRLPVPCMSAGNVVNVLEETELFCRIETVKHDSAFPDSIREIPYLTHTWFAYKGNGDIYRPAGGVLWPLLARGTSAWVQKAGLAKL